jgi:hypothetical protein
MGPYDGGTGRRRTAEPFRCSNIAQVDGYEPVPIAGLLETERLAHAETFITNLGVIDDVVIMLTI